MKPQINPRVTHPSYLHLQMEHLTTVVGMPFTPYTLSER